MQWNGDRFEVLKAEAGKQDGGQDTGSSYKLNTTYQRYCKG